MHDQTRSVFQSIAAILFLGLIGAVLARPVFSSNDPEPGPGGAVERKSPKPVKRTPSLTPKPTPTDDHTPTGLELGDRYPSTCLDSVQPPTGMGLIAAYRYGQDGNPHQVDIATPSGSPVGSALIAPPISWSPSGNLLLDRAGALSTPAGRRAGTAFGARVAMPLAWSPVADCVVGADRTRIIVGLAGRSPVTILRGPATGFSFANFSFSEDGTKIFFSTSARDGVLDLARHRLSPGGRAGPSGRAPGRSASRDLCDRNKVADYIWPTCSPDGRYIAAVKDGRLSLLSREGHSFIRYLTSDSGYEDAYPIWGPPRTGIVFVRSRLGSPKSPAEIWFVAEGGTPRNTGLTLPPPFKDVSATSWGSFFDWSVAERPRAPLPVVGD